MRLILILFFALLLSPTVVLAQSNDDKCLINEDGSFRVSGTVEYVSFEHPHRDVIISGYKRVLLKPRCFQAISQATGENLRSDIKEIGLQGYWAFSELLENNIGKTVTVTGDIRNETTIYYITTPQIYAESIVPCQVSPKVKGVEKC